MIEKENFITPQNWKKIFNSLYSEINDIKVSLEKIEPILSKSKDYKVYNKIVKNSKYIINKSNVITDLAKRLEITLLDKFF